MGLGGTAKKIQKLADTAETLYAKMNEIVGELREVQADVEATSERVSHLEEELADQRALLEALAAERGIDPEEVLVDAGGTPGPGDTEGDPVETTEDA